MASKWDYTKQAKYYRYRPNYHKEAIASLVAYVRPRSSSNYIVADVGAGTGNLTKLLLSYDLNCLAIEPNAAMRQIGKMEIKSKKVHWIAATAEKTTLKKTSIDWYAMGSSFNTTDRPKTLKEAHRVLRPCGFFTCMWNNRDLESDPVQRKMEEIIKKFVPNYE